MVEIIDLETRRKDIELNHYWQNGFRFFNNPYCIAHDQEDRVVISDWKAIRAMLMTTEDGRVKAEESYKYLTRLARAQFVAKFIRERGRVMIVLLKPLNSKK